MSYTCCSRYVLLSGKLKLRKTFAVTHLMHYSSCNRPGCTQTAGDVTWKLSKPSCKGLSHGEAESRAARGTHILPLHVCVESCPPPVPVKLYTVVGCVKRYTAKTQICRLFSSSFPTSLIFRLVPGLGLLNY